MKRPHIKQTRGKRAHVGITTSGRPMSTLWGVFSIILAIKEMEDPMSTLIEMRLPTLSLGESFPTMLYGWKVW